MGRKALRSRVEISFTAAAGATNYAVEWRNGTSGKWESSQTKSADLTVSFRAVPGDIVQARVKAWSKLNNESAKSAVTQHTVVGKTPATLLAIAFSASGTLKGFNLVMSRVTDDDFDSYEIFESTTSTAPTAASNPTYEKITDRKKVLTGYSPGDARYFWARWRDTSDNVSNWIAGGQQTAGKVAPGEIATNAVGSDEIGPDSVGNVKLKQQSVSLSRIIKAAVTKSATRTYSPGTPLSLPGSSNWQEVDRISIQANAGDITLVIGIVVQCQQTPVAQYRIRRIKNGSIGTGLKVAKLFCANLCENTITFNESFDAGSGSSQLPDADDTTEQLTYVLEMSRDGSEAIAVVSAYSNLVNYKR